MRSVNVDVVAARQPPKRKRLSAEARRRLILDAARDVFVENGHAGGRLRDIAERAGITEAYLYRYFTSKTELYHAAIYEPVERIIEEFGRKLDEMTATPDLTAADLLQRLNEIMLEFTIAAVPYLGVALFSDLSLDDSFYETTIRPGIYEPVKGVLGAIKGWPDRSVDLDVVVDAMWSLNYGIALDGLLRGVDIDAARAAKRVTRLYTVGIPQFKAARAAR
ncbi:MAG TPA: TetR/AcrR family transcriptional regulator [Acidimicrobiia bacterium]|nr:TetR/AcrR family transcriptional regulator [Acidimicrobiia bacterium]